MRKLIALLLIPVLLLTSGCRLQHRYYCNDVDVPETWRTVPETMGDQVNSCWWAAFDDPVLDNLIAEALEYNRNLQEAIARILQFYAQLGIIRSELYPQLDLEGSYLRQRVSRLTTPFLLDRNPIASIYTLFLNLSYELDIWGRIQNATGAALADLLASDAAARAVLITLCSDVASAYVELREFDKQLAISQQTLKSREEYYRIAVKRFEGGLTSEMEPKQAESEVESALAAVIRIQLLIAQRENLISVLVGHAPSAVERGLWLDDLTLPQIPSDMPSDVVVQRPDIQEAEQRLIAAHLRVDEARADYFPSIVLTGTFGTQSNTTGGLFTGPSGMWSYGAAFLQPIFHAGRITNQVRYRRAQELEAINHYESVILTAFREVDDALVGHQKAKNLVVVQRRLVKVLEDYLKLATLQYDNGETEYLNVLDAQRKLFDAQLEYASAQGDEYLTLIDLYRALGGGW